MNEERREEVDAMAETVLMRPDQIPTKSSKKGLVLGLVALLVTVAAAFFFLR